LPFVALVDNEQPLQPRAISVTGSGASVITPIHPPILTTSQALDPNRRAVHLRTVVAFQIEEHELAVSGSLQRSVPTRNVPAG
jgi:hypothetical protein